MGSVSSDVLYGQAGPVALNDGVLATTYVGRISRPRRNPTIPLQAAAWLRNGMSDYATLIRPTFCQDFDIVWGRQYASRNISATPQNGGF